LTPLALIQALHLGPISATAKKLEQLIGIDNLVITGAIDGAVLSSFCAQSAEGPRILRVSRLAS
jgi:hypothetical protein